ncbi:sulfotransferase family protein [Devosia sp. CAU 1758]
MGVAPIGPVPHFLIIGAMKAGTTTLFRDLVEHPDIFLPQEKEPEILTRHSDDRTRMMKEFASLFAPARHGQLRGEASTAYSKRPDFEGVAECALRVCGPDLKLIYLTRDPIKRAISQYRHEYGAGQVSEGIDEALLKHQRYVSYGRYQWQLAPWRETFGEANLLVLSFEDYIVNRQATIDRVCVFLKIDPAKLPPIQADRAFNANDGKLIPTGPWKRLIASPTYQRVIKPRLPWKLRDMVASRVLVRARSAQTKISMETKLKFDEAVNRM